MHNANRKIRNKFMITDEDSLKELFKKIILKNIKKLD